MPKEEGEDCGGSDGGGDGGEIGMVVVTAHSGSSGSSSSSWGSGSSYGSSGTGWGSGGGYPSFPGGGSSSGGGGGGSYSGDDGESYDGGKIGIVIVKGRKKVKTEEKDSDKSLPLLPLSELADEKGEPLKEKQEPEKKEEDKKEPCKTTIEDLQKVFPNTDSGTLKEIADLVNQYGKDFGIDSKEKLQHFLAQAGHESRSVVSGKPFGAFKENLNYRWKELGKRYWINYFNPIETPTKDPAKADPRDYKRSATSPFVDAEKFANKVYGGRNGNNTTGDGYKYIGRGLFQLTGKYNYTRFNTFYQQHYDKVANLVDNPGLVATNPKIRVINALWYFKYCVMNHFKNGMDETDKTLLRVSQIVNGSKKPKGLSDRQSIFKATKTSVKCH